MPSRAGQQNTASGIDESMTGLFRRVARRLGATPEDLDRPAEQKRCTDLGGTPCAQLTGRMRVCLVGTLRSVTTCPAGSSPALTAELADGSGFARIVWSGRRAIAGIRPGARLRVSGLAAVHDGTPVMYNPRYELLPRDDA